MIGNKDIHIPRHKGNSQAYQYHASLQNLYIILLLLELYNDLSQTLLIQKYVSMK